MAHLFKMHQTHLRGMFLRLHEKIYGVFDIKFQLVFLLKFDFFCFKLIFYNDFESFMLKIKFKK